LQKKCSAVFVKFVSRYVVTATAMNSTGMIHYFLPQLPHQEDGWMSEKEG